MDDFSSMLNNFMKDPANMEKIKSLASMLDGNGGHNPAPPPGEPAQKNAQPSDGAYQDAVQTMMKLAPLISKFRQEDDGTRLLRALRPFLNDRKKKKLDEAIRLMQIVRLIPFIRRSGLL